MKTKPRNKILRQNLFKAKMERKAKNKFLLEKKQQESGIDKPKGIPKTIENCRQLDPDMVDDQDEECLIEQEIEQNEIGTLKETKIMITTCLDPSKRLKRFCVDLTKVFPKTKFINRKKFNVKKMIKAAIEHQFTTIFLISDNNKIPDNIVLINLPEGPSIHFKLSNVNDRTELKKIGDLTNHPPELMLNNFTTKVGQLIGKTLSSFFSVEPDFIGRRLITFHTQRDFIFFRHHRYEFRNNERVGIQELGPRFTMQLRAIRTGVFDNIGGEFDWIYKRRVMHENRRKFFM